MANPFSTYEILPAETIFTQNIHMTTVCSYASLGRTRCRLPYLERGRSECVNQISVASDVHQQTGTGEAELSAFQCDSKTERTRSFYAVQRCVRADTKVCASSQERWTCWGISVTCAMTRASITINPRRIAMRKDGASWLLRNANASTMISNEWCQALLLATNSFFR